VTSDVQSASQLRSIKTLFDQYKIILLDDRATCVLTTCPESLYERVTSS